jgi:hypothetical protein
VGYGDIAPATTMGRTFTSIWMIVSLISVSIFTSILTSTYTSAQLLTVPLDSLGGITAGLCIEEEYPSVHEYVFRQASRPKTIIEDDLPACFDKLAAGAVQAVLTDRPIITWFADAFDMEGLYVSPVLKPNPFAFVYRNNVDSTALRNQINPAVIAATTDPDWVVQAEQLKAQYAVGDSAGKSLNSASADAAVETLNLPIRNAAVVLAVVTGAVTLWAHWREVVAETKASLHATAILVHEHSKAAHGGAKRLGSAAAAAATGRGKAAGGGGDADAEAAAPEEGGRAARLQDLARTPVGSEGGVDASEGQLAELTAMAELLLAKCQAMQQQSLAARA